MNNKVKLVKISCWTWVLKSLEDPKPQLDLTEREKYELRAKLDRMLAESMREINKAL